MQLEPSVQSKVDEFVDKAYEYFEEGNYVDSFNSLAKAWDSIPDPKEQYYESFNVAKYLFEDNLKLSRLEEANKWLKEIKRVQEKHPDTWIGGEVEFLEGKLHFENNALEQAKESFLVAMRNSEGRAFEGEPKKYIDLLKNK